MSKTKKNFFVCYLEKFLAEHGIINKKVDVYENPYGIIQSTRHRGLGVCPQCRQFNTNYAWCLDCDTKNLICQFSNWTSEDQDIDRFIRATQQYCWEYEGYLEWIPFDRFENPKHLARGGFSTVYHATWLDGKRESQRGQENEWSKGRGPPITVALKTVLAGAEVQTHFKVLNKHRENLKLLGITRHVKENKLFMVLQYAGAGNLRHNIEANFAGWKWKDKLRILKDVAFQLDKFHKEGFTHCDLHSGNILFSNEKNKNYVFVVDVGLSRPQQRNELGNLIEGTYGVMRYMAPELFRNNPTHTPKSDIYALGMIMWEISSGQPPFIGRPSEPCLALDIVQGIRPDIIEGTPKCFAFLLQKCWSSDPTKRPTAEHVYNTLEAWYDGVLNPNSELLQKLQHRAEQCKQFEVADNLPPRKPTRDFLSEDQYTSKFYPTSLISEVLISEIASAGLSIDFEKAETSIDSTSLPISNQIEAVETGIDEVQQVNEPVCVKWWYLIGHSEFDICNVINPIRRKDLDGKLIKNFRIQDTHSGKIFLSERIYKVIYGSSTTQIGDAPPSSIVWTVNDVDP